MCGGLHILRQVRGVSELAGRLGLGLDGGCRQVKKEKGSHALQEIVVHVDSRFRENHLPPL